MTETSGYWTTDDTTPEGHQVASYTQVIAAKAWAILAACGGFEGVAPGYLNALVGSVTGANTARIGTGGGIVDGQWYENGAAVDVNIPSAVGGGNTRIDRVVLRITWASFACVITRIAGTDAGSPTAPAITQTPGTTYDIKLYQALVNTGGTVTLTDERSWATRGLVYRQGGSATIWSTQGSTNYQPGRVIIQTGVINTSAGGAVEVTFPEPFAYAPNLLVTSNLNGIHVYIDTTSLTTNHFYVSAYSHTDDNRTVVPVSWLAIGPAVA